MEPGWRLVVAIAALVPTWAFYAVPWLAGLAVAGATTHRHGPLRALGLGLMTVPLWDTALGIIDSFGPLLQGGVVLQSYSTLQLSRIYSYKFLADLGYLGVGFLLFAGGARILDQTPRTLAARMAELGFPMGRRSEGASALIGIVGFPVLLLGTVGVDLATRGLESLRQSDESSVFANMTLYHAVLISLAAAFGEELLYRGFLQTLLARAFRRVAAPRRLGQGLAVGVAVVVQAVFFGFAHSGYATWIHVLLPALFGLVAGIAAWRFGIWSAIVLHLVVDLYAFFAEVAVHVSWVWTLLNGFFLANLAVSLGWGIAWLVRRFSQQPVAA